MATKKNSENIIPHKWPKGKSGNPKGRPKDIDLKAEVMKILSEKQNNTSAVEAILKALRNKAVKGDVKAASELFDRGFGRSKQNMDLTTGGQPIQMPSVTIKYEAEK